MWADDVDRARFAHHPWSLSGGGAGDLLELVEKAAREPLGRRVAEIGFGAVTREDNAYMVGDGALRRARCREGLSPRVPGVCGLAG